jgi:hypothetical protein
MYIKEAVTLKTSPNQPLKFKSEQILFYDIHTKKNALQLVIKNRQFHLKAQRLQT